MQTENIINYIKQGVSYSNKEIRKYIIIFSLSFIMITTIIGVVVKGCYLISSVFFDTFSLLSIISIFLLTSHSTPRTIKKRILMNLILSTYCFTGVSLIAFFVWTLIFEVNVFILLIILPPIITYIFAFSITIYKLRTHNYKIKKTSAITTGGALSGTAGLLGMIISKHFLPDDNLFGIIVLLVILILFQCILSIGFNNIIKLFYMKKLEKQDIIINEVIDEKTVFVNKK